MYMLCVVVGVGGGGRCVYVAHGCRGWWRGVWWSTLSLQLHPDLNRLPMWLS